MARSAGHLCIKRSGWPRSAAMKWPDTKYQEARGEGPKPLPKVRQVWWQAHEPSCLVPPHFNYHLNWPDPHQVSECPYQLICEFKCQKFGVSPHFVPLAERATPHYRPQDLRALPVRGRPDADDSVRPRQGHFRDGRTLLHQRHLRLRAALLVFRADWCVFT